MTIRKIALAAAATAVGLSAVAYSAIWLLGERIIARKYVTPPQDISAVSDPAVIAEGERLANIAGCLGCHSAGLNGKPFGEEAFIYRSTTANIPRLAAHYTDDDLARSIRHGVKKNGRSVIGMPSPAFFDMRDEDLVAIISYARTLPDRGENLPKSATWIRGRLELIQGLYPPEASTIKHRAKRRVYDFTKPVEHGAYLARMACSECHGLDFTGDPTSDEPGSSPDLAIAGAYSLDQFAHLMKTGEPVGGRDLRLMDDVARDRFSHFTGEEIAALHAFFAHRAETM
jgi:cytochrome c553